MSSQIETPKFVPVISGGSPGLDSYAARVAALGATLTATDRNAVGKLISDLNTAGIWNWDNANRRSASFDYLYVLLGGNASDTATNKYNQKRVNIANPGTFDATITSANASGHVAGGVLGNGTMYWDTGYRAGLSLYSRDSNASMGVMVHNNPVLNNRTDAGSLAAPSAILQYRYSGTECYTYYGGSAATNWGSRTIPSVLWTNTTSNNVQSFDNTTSLGNSATGTEAMPAENVYLFCYKASGGGATGITDAVHSLHWHGQSFNSTQRTALYNAIKTLAATYGLSLP